MKDLTGQKFNRLLVLGPTNERKQGCVVWECQCDCGQIVKVPTRSLKSNNTKSCGCLNNDRRKENIQKYNKTFNTRDLIGQRFGKLVILEETDKRVAGRIVWKCKCDCGNICYVSSNNLNEQYGTKSCGCLIKENAHYNNLVGQTFGKLTVLEKTEERKHENIVWKCRCECGNIAYVPTQSLTSSGTKSCGCLRSQGEEKIISILQKNNIAFVKEYSFIECKNENGYPLYFDFYINNKYVVEYDGIQHFQETGWEPLEIVQSRDRIKNDWCKKNNIPIIRIPYTALNSISLKDLLLETSQYIL